MQPQPLELRFLGGADAGHPAGHPSRQRQRTIVSRGQNRDVAGDRADVIDGGCEHVHVDVRRREHHRSQPLGDHVALMRVELAERLHGQHGADAVRHDIEASDRRARQQSDEHLLQRVARPHGAVALIAVVQQIRLGRPGERHRVAVEPDAVRQAGRVEHRGLECLIETMNVDQHIAGARRRPGQVADLRHHLERIEAPIVEPDRGERKSAIARRRELGVHDAQSGRTFGPEPGFRTRAVHGLAVGRHHEGRIGRDFRSVIARTGRCKAGAAAQREQGCRRSQPSQHGAA